ncbi:hypothetical protein [Achromobacter dolens]|uniref:hypothetical protein n=1 Tax=Achromobacter dolens TaxID=1287738 RepID=UPI0011A6D062|nr:hypothetical protein [Achromobacter dolens]
MSVVDAGSRIDALVALGASAPLVRLASGDCVHPLLRGACLGPPFHSYHGASAPQGAPLAPLWDDGDQVYALRGTATGREFIRFSIEAPQSVDVLALTEQGFWAHRFDFLYETDAPLDDLRAAAGAVQFRHVEAYLAAREAFEDPPGHVPTHRDWLTRTIASIDRRARLNI